MQFRSGLEQRVAKEFIKYKVPFEYEPKEGKLKYLVPAKISTYIPDFYITTKNGKTIIIEVKGLWVYEDRLKHYYIKKQYPKLDIRFIFSSSKKKIRKGSKTTYADICNGKGRGIFKGITWKYCDKEINKKWLLE